MYRDLSRRYRGKKHCCSPIKLTVLVWRSVYYVIEYVHFLDYNNACLWF